MKRHLLTTLALPAFMLCISACFSCKSQSDLPSFTYKHLPKDSTLNKLWGDSIAEIINAPTAIRAYKMHPNQTRQDSLIGDYSVEHFIGTLDMTYASPLIFFLNDSLNYNLSDDKVKTPFTPTIAFEFQQKEKGVSVVISFNGNQLAIIREDKEIGRRQFLNPRYLLRLSLGLQPQNEYLNYMLNQQKNISK